MNDKVYVTLLSSDDFLEGVLMLKWSLQRVKSRFPLFVLCSNTVSQHVINVLNRKRLLYQILDESISAEGDINKDKGYDHWNRTFDKLCVWKLTQFGKIVYVDSDMQVIKNIDHLFDYPHMSAVRADTFNEPGIDKLNSGLMVIEPNTGEFEGLCDVLYSGEIRLKNMGDQDVIRAFYKDWGKHPELTLEPGMNVFYSEVSRGIIRKPDVAPVSVIHYIGPKKPWMVSPRAIWRRSRNNFLGNELIKYSLAMYVRFPFLLFKNGLHKMTTKLPIL